MQIIYVTWMLPRLLPKDDLCSLVNEFEVTIERVQRQPILPSRSSLSLVHITEQAPLFENELDYIDPLFL